LYKRLLITFAACFLAAILIGTVVSLLLFRLYHIQPWNPRALTLLPLLILLTFLGLLFRFWRWHYILRRAGIRLPTRLSIGIYLAGFSQTIVPLFVGEIALKAALVRRHSQAPLGRIISTIAYDRLLDFLALAILTLPYLILVSSAKPFWSYLPICIAALMLFAPIRKAFWRTVSRGLASVIGRLISREPASLGGTPEALTSYRVIGVALVFSLLSWLAVTSILPISAAVLGGDITWLHGIGVYAVSSFAGGASLSPAGVGITGSFMAQALIQSGIMPSTAGLAGLVTRLSTFGLVFAVGVIFLGIYYWKYGRAAADSQKKSIDYETEFAEEAREYYVEKKAHLIEETVHRDQPRDAFDKSLVLDIGCGPGWYLPLISDEKSSVIGIDASLSQLRLARKNVPDSTLLSGDICNFPLKHGQFDVAYAINIFHHLPSAEEQQQGFREIHRILKTGGVLMLHEMNVTNPLFRFYLGYVLPLFNKVDQGTEFWIMPKELQSSSLFQLRHTEYFTFLPDFLPGWLLRILRGPELLLERSPLRKLSAHYMAVLQKA